MDTEEMQEQYEGVLERENRLIKSGYQKSTNASWTPPEVQVVFEHYLIPPLKHPTFTPLIIPSDERLEATFKMLKQRGRGAGGFETDEPVPSLWYADFKALRDGMRTRIDDYGEVYEKVVVEPVAEAITQYVEEYRREYGRHRLIGWQKAISRVYREVMHGRPWSDIEPRVVLLLPPKYVKRIRLHVLRPNDLDDRRDLTDLLNTRDGLLDEIRPTVLQWEAAQVALRSIATQRPIHALPDLFNSPFAGTQKAYTYAQDMVDAYYDAIADPSLAMKGHSDLNTAIVSFTDHSPGAVREAMRRVGLRAGDDYEKRNVGDYVRAVEKMIKQHNRCT